MNILNGCSLVAYPGRDDRHHRPQRRRQVDAAQGHVRPGAACTPAQVTLDGKDITNLKANRLVEMGVGFVPQTNNVFPTLTIEENLRMGLFLRPRSSRERLEAMWDLFPVLHDRRNQRAGALSGGERQSLAMARALMMEPSVLLLDEPSAGLSPVRQDETFIRTRRINKTGVCVVMVEQNARRCLQICDRGYVLDQGRDAYTGTGRELANDPKVIELYLGTLAKDVDEARAPAATDPSASAQRRQSTATADERRPSHARRRPRTLRSGAFVVQLGRVSSLDRTLHRGGEDVLVVGVVGVDAHERRRRVVLLVDRTDARGTGVADLVTARDQRRRTRRTSRTPCHRGTRDGGQVLLDGRAAWCRHP